MTTYSVVMFGQFWRVMDGARIAAVCETRAEADLWIARQPGDGLTDVEREIGDNDVADYVRQILRVMPNGLDEMQFLRRCIEDVRGGYDAEVVAAFRIYVKQGRSNADVSR